MNETIYLDYAATAPLCEEAACAMAPYFMAGRGNIMVGANANSLHSPGRAAFAALESARKELAAALGVKHTELIFTSGATEADNAALLGIARARAQRLRQEGKGGCTPRIITSAIEHPAVLEPAKQLAREGFDVVCIPPDRTGAIDPERLSAALTVDTVLVSIQWANSETGALQPVASMAKQAHAVGALFHTDATQALGKIPLDILGAGVDAASFSAHKIGGPKGMGALYLKTRTPFTPQALGGGQEARRRSGTQNVAGAVGFAAAARAAVALAESECVRLGALRDMLYSELSRMPHVVATCDVVPGSRMYLPNIVHIMVRGMESETLILRLDNAGVCVSGGSACSSGSLEPSATLVAMGVQRDLALGALRISMGRYTCESDVSGFLEAFSRALL